MKRLIVLSALIGVGALSLAVTAQQPPASRNRILFTFCSRLVTASPAHRLQRHRKPRLPCEQ